MGRMCHENNEQMSVTTTSPESVWVGAGSDWAEFRSDHSGHGQVQHLLMKLLTVHPPTVSGKSLFSLLSSSIELPGSCNKPFSGAETEPGRCSGWDSSACAGWEERWLDGGERMRVGGGFRHCHLV